MALPTAPISTPCSMKMRRICAAPRAHRHQHGDVAVLFHHHHHQRDENVERGHQLDQPDGDDGHRALHAAARRAAGGCAPSRWWWCSAGRRSSPPRAAISGARFRSSTLSSIWLTTSGERERLLRGRRWRRRPSCRRSRRSRFRKCRRRGTGGTAGAAPKGVSSPFGMTTSMREFEHHAGVLDRCARRGRCRAGRRRGRAGGRASPP